MPGKTLAEKLLLKAGAPLALLHAPPEHPQPDGTVTASVHDAEAVLLYARRAEELTQRLGEVVPALRPHARLWLCYPKGGQLGTDLHRERLWELAAPFGLDAVRQIALDDTWSALWFKRVP